MRPEADPFETDDPAGDEPDFRGMVETIPHLVWQSSPRGDWIWASRQWAAFTGQSPARSRGCGWLDAVHPEDRARTREAWRMASRRGHVVIEHRLARHAADGPAGDPYRWFSTRAMPRRDGDGRPETWFGTSTDIHDLYLMREAQVHLLQELQRRGRNNLAVVRGIVRRVAATAASAEEAAAYVDDRLAAMARIQTKVSRDEPLTGVALDVLIRDELSAHALPEPSELSGPPVRLPVEVAEKLGLALHELVRGAVLNGHDRIAVTWSATATQLALTWRERARPGRGRTGDGALRGEILERMLAYDLRAATSISETERDRAFVIVLPLPR
ncbi:PAS domain S-box protein [Methylobacterium terricola]|uniref:Blue-light-activated histidine kinase n=1 Tax=Methylobacterium terricola TaxID=2583531 RepID=A0A5C4LD95_9HYPH|nr:PAS domain-containing protein [Methylobacterium terricola]TNC11417.1 PAS domain S-box protein [Methylobacterium terricola]